VSGKRLRTDAVVSELAAGSVFFQQAEGRPPAAPPAEPATAEAAVDDAASSRASTVDSSFDSEVASQQASTPAIGRARTHDRRQAGSHDSMQTGTLAGTLAGSDDLVDAIHRVIRRPGKEISYVRMTEREKSAVGAALVGIMQEYGYKVSETELIRIAICGLLADHAEHEDDSLLMRVVRALKD
jgi:hypothetical protein